MVNFLQKILELGAFVVIIPIMLIPVVYHLADQEHQTIQSNSLYKTFDSEIFESFEKQIDTAGHVVAFGKNLPEVMHFANQYAFEKMELQWKVIKWLLDDDTSFQRILYLSDIRQQLQAYMDLETQKSTLWVIEFRVKAKDLKKEAINFIQSMAKRHPRSKFLIAAEDKINIKGFKQYEVPAIDQNQFFKTLAYILNTSIDDAKIVVDHYGSVAKTLQMAQGNVLSIDSILGIYNRDLTDQTKKQLSTLKDLCKKGQVKSKKQMPGVDAMGTFFYEGKYYWRSFESVLNYKLKTNIKKCVYLDPGVPELLIPTDSYSSKSVKTQQIEQVEEEPEQFFDDKNNKEDQADQNDQPVEKVKTQQKQQIQQKVNQNIQQTKQPSAPEQKVEQQPQDNQIQTPAPASTDKMSEQQTNNQQKKQQQKPQNTAQQL